MPTNQSFFQNYATLEFAIKFNVAGGAGAVQAITNPDNTTKTCTADGFTVVRTGVGTYTATLKNTSALRLVEDLGFLAGFEGVAAPAGALDVRVTSVTQPGGSSGDDIIIGLSTVATAGGAAADLTSTTSVVIKGAIRIARIVNVL